MNIFIFLCTIILYLIVSLYLTKNNFIYPTNIVIFMYLVSTIFFVSEMNNWGGDLSNQATFLLFIGITVYLVTGLFVYLVFSKFSLPSSGSVTVNEKIQIAGSIVDVKVVVTLIIILYEVLATIKYYLEVRGSVSAVSVFSSFGEMVGNYRNLSAFTSSSGISVGVSSLSVNNYRIMTAVAYIYMAIIVKHWVAKRKTDFFWKVTHWLPILLFLLCSLFSGGRNPIIQLIIAFIVMYYIEYKQRNRNLKFDFKVVIKFLVIGLIVLLSFSIFRGVVGRTSTSSTWDYLATYIGAPMKLFDLFIRDGGNISHIYMGQETFANLLESFGKIIPNHANLEFRFFNGVGLGNVYTPFRRYYSDFGLMGLILLTGLESLFYSSYYLKVEKQRFNATKISFLALLYSFIAIGPFYYSIVERFYLFLSKGQLIVIIEMFIISKLITYSKNDG